jgi:microcystin-dependent protein
MDGFVGEIRIWTADWAPTGWMLCQGQELPIDDHPILAHVLGDTYGGNGHSRFGLPDLRGRTVVGSGSGPGLQTHPIGQQGGAPSVALSESEMPRHTHSMKVNSNVIGDSVSPIGNYPGSSDFSAYSGDPDNGMNAGMIDNVGGSEAHSNMQPYQVVNYIICVEGTYPQPE